MEILRANGIFLKANGKILVRPENKIDPDIVILQDWVTQGVGLQPTSGTVPSANFDPDGPLDVSGTGWSGTPYVSNQDIGWANVRVPESGYSTNFWQYAQNQLVYDNLWDYGFYGPGVDFTVEAWLRLSQSASSGLQEFRNQPLVGLLNSGMSCLFGLHDSGISYYNHNGLTSISQYSVIQGWHHYAIVVHDNVARIYLDGTKWGGDMPISYGYMQLFMIAKRGHVNWAGTWYDKAKYDYAQVCLTKRAKWLENFTPPTRPYCLGMEE